ncbi:MAG: endonuclease, partial [Deferribacterota bacterium]|nr:endonuclease [Deferribacterota bacterium]
MRKKLLFILLNILIPLNLIATTFKVATYNVENLFDLYYNNREYPEYIPFTGFRWNEDTFHKKINNIAKVLCDLDADIVALQEIESPYVLNTLVKKINEKGCKNYKYKSIVDDNYKIPIRSAILSTFPIVESSDINIEGDYRDILKVTVKINDAKLLIYVNHWPSKRYPESHRVYTARKLLEDLKNLKKGTDYIILGDFNSNYNEYLTFRYNRLFNKLNNTKGITGINHILKTVEGGQLVDKFFIINRDYPFYHYNLWLELPKHERYSYIFRNRKETPDNIILSPYLFDNKSISYIDRSFNVFKKSYLFKDSEIFRWQRAKSGKAWHLGKGYSDHLPIYANFNDKPFKLKQDFNDIKTTNIKDLYKIKKAEFKAILKDCVIIYKNNYSCILKRKNDRAIYCYKCLDRFGLNGIYDILIHKLKNFHGLTEIVSATVINYKGKEKKISDYYLKCNKETDFNANINEVCSKVVGLYKDGYLYIGEKKIKLYTKKHIKLKNNKKILLKKVRIS